MQIPQFIRNLLLAAAMALASMMPCVAHAAGCLPIVGVFNGVEFTENINAGFAALISSNRGGSPPVTDCSGVTVEGQLWEDTSGGYPVFRIWDSNVGLPIGWLDKANHIWMPPMGGGLATLTAAATTDIGSVPQSFLTINGSTPITSFGASAVIGQVKFLNFTGTTTITYNTGAILTPLSASITTAAGDQAVAVYLGGGIWRVAFYQSANAPSLSGGAAIGVHEWSAGTSCPSGDLLEDGSSYLQSAYPKLYAQIGTTWGSTDGTHFNVPNMLGRVARAIDGGSGNGGPSAVGALQADQVGPYSASVSVISTTSVVKTIGGVEVTISPAEASAAASPTTGTITSTGTVSGGAAETRVKAAGMLPCIRAF